MRLIAAGDTYWEFERTKRYLSELKEGVVLFSEGSFDSSELDWTLEDLAEYAKDFPMTIVGEKEERIYIVKKGLITPAQSIYDSQTMECMTILHDELYDISYEPSRKVKALSRICATASAPYEGKGKADLLLIASGGMDWREGIDELIEAHGKNLKPDALIMQSDLHGANQFIYSLKDKSLIGEEITGEQGDDYVVHDI